MAWWNKPITSAIKRVVMLMAHAGPALTDVMSSRPGQASFKSLSQKNKAKMGLEV